MSAEPLAFGPFVLFPATGILLRDREPVLVGQRGARLLHALLNGANRVLTKSELIEAAWPGMAIEESNLSVQIAALRKHLGRSTFGGEWIVTIPRIGYRLVVSDDGVTTPAQTQGALSSAVPSLAALPFLNLSGDPEQDYFVDGVVEDIITALSRFRSFAVIARNSSFTYKGRAVDVRVVAKELGVRYVLDGSVRLAGQQLRISVQLLDGPSGAYLWAHNYDGAAEGIFDFHDRLIASVVAVVEPRIQQAEIDRSRRERRGSLAAYDLYLRALAKLRTFHQADNVEAYALLSDALRLEPENGILLAHAAWALEHRTSMGWPPIGPDDAQKSLQLARAALELSRNDATVLAHCGLVLQLLACEYDLGLSLIRRGVDLNPNNLVVLTRAGVGSMLGGDLEDALKFFQRAIVLNPNDTFEAMGGTAYALTCLERYEEALEWASRSLALNPNYTITHWNLIAANAHLQRLDEAKRALAAYSSMAPDTTLAAVRGGLHFKDPRRVAVLIDGMRIAGMREN